MDNELTNELCSLGMLEREAWIYLTLAQHGRIQATVLARKIGIPRTSVYPSLESLIQRGFVSEHIESGTTFFSANTPDALLTELNSEKRELEQRTQRAQILATRLKPLFRKSSYSVPSLEYFDGSENVENMLHRYLDEWMTSMRQTGDILWGYQDHTFVQTYQEWLELYWKTKSPNHQIRLFSNESEEERALRHQVSGREIRTLPGGQELMTTLWISGDYVTVIMTREQPHYGFQVRDIVFAESLRRVFQSLWGQS